MNGSLFCTRTTVRLICSLQRGWERQHYNPNVTFRASQEHKALPTPLNFQNGRVDEVGRPELDGD